MEATCHDCPWDANLDPVDRPAVPVDGLAGARVHVLRAATMLPKPTEPTTEPVSERVRVPALVVGGVVVSGVTLRRNASAHEQAIGRE